MRPWVLGCFRWKRHTKRAAGVERRIIIQRATGRNGGEYRYFFCRGVQDHTCDAPYNNTDLVEAAIEEHYKTVQLSPEFVASLRTEMNAMIADTATASRLHRKQLTTQLKQLDVKEEICSISPPQAHSPPPRSSNDSATSSNNVNASPANSTR